MEIMRKTDICISVIQNAIATLGNIAIVSDLSNKDLEKLKSLHNELQESCTLELSSDKMMELENIFPKRLLIQKLTRLKALFYYRILPVYNYDTMYRDEDDVYSDLCLNNHYTGGDHYKEVLSILQEETINLKDLEYEFWSICPNIESLNMCLGITRVKFNRISSNLSLLDSFTIENLFYKPNKYRDMFERLSEIGLITDKEIKLIFMLVISIARSIKTNMGSIASMYNDLKKMSDNNTAENKHTNIEMIIPKECDSERFRSMVNKAIKKNLITINNDGTLYFDGSEALLSCFCGIAICGDSLKWDPATRIFIIKKGNERLFPNKHLNKLFNANNIGNSRTQILEREPPGGFHLIEDIIKETA